MFNQEVLIDVQECLWNSSSQRTAMWRGSHEGKKVPLDGFLIFPMVECFYCCLVEQGSCLTE